MTATSAPKTGASEETEKTGIQNAAEWALETRDDIEDLSALYDQGAANLKAAYKGLSEGLAQDTTKTTKAVSDYLMGVPNPYAQVIGAAMRVLAEVLDFAMSIREPHWNTRANKHVLTEFMGGQKEADQFVLEDLASMIAGFHRDVPIHQSAFRMIGRGKGRIYSDSKSDPWGHGYFEMSDSSGKTDKTQIAEFRAARWRAAMLLAPTAIAEVVLG